MKIKPQFVILLLVATIIAVIGIAFNFYHYAKIENVMANLDFTSLSTFSGAFSWVISGGYILMFIGMFVEGPVITAAAAFAAALGYFSLITVLVLSISADLVGDSLCYWIGYFGRVRVVEKYGHKIGLTTQRIERIERLIKTHPKKTMLSIKLAPFLPPFGLAMIGTTRMPFGQYALISFLITLPKAIIFMALGYFFGHTYETISHYIQNGEYFIIIGLIIIIIIYYAYKKISERISKNLENL